MTIKFENMDGSPSKAFSGSADEEAIMISDRNRRASNLKDEEEPFQIDSGHS